MANPGYRKPNAECAACGSPAYIRPSNKEVYSNTFCSNECYQETRHRKRPTHCAFCQGPIGKYGSKYCSRACSNRGRAGIKYDGTNKHNKVRWYKRLRQKVIDEHGEKCDWCGQGNEWFGKPLVLQIDHIDGNRKNNDFKNLRLLCPNCHTQTKTWGVQKTLPTESI